VSKRWGIIIHWPLVVVLAVLLIISLSNLYSAVYGWGEGSSSLSLFWSQLMWISIGICVLLISSFLDYRALNTLAYPFYGIMVLLLIGSLFSGHTVRGTHGWLKLGPITLQPAEFAKIAYIFVAAKYFSKHSELDGHDTMSLAWPGLLMFLMFGLIVAQGDLGSSLFLICIFISMAAFAKIRRKTMIIFGIIAIVGALCVYTFGLKEYQRNRISTFMNPEADIRGSGYHLMQSKVAVGSGGIWGKGYLKGDINKLRYLPERHTDFIFPVFAEEWGFVGSLILLGLYCALLLIGVDIGAHARDRFGIFLSIGIVSLWFWQIVINLGGVLGLMPLTGVTLPLLSYGGSSMIAVMLSIGIVLSIHYRRFLF